MNSINFNDNNPANEIHKIDSETFHQFLIATHGDSATPFIEWAKATPLKDKISPNQLEKLVSFYNSSVEYSTICDALKIDNDVKKDMFNIFEDKKITDRMRYTFSTSSNVPPNLPLEKINSEDFHLYLINTYGDKAVPFINWANQTTLVNEITPKELNLVIQSYSNGVNFEIITFMVGLKKDVSSDLTKYVRENNNETPVVPEYLQKKIEETKINQTVQHLRDKYWLTSGENKNKP